MTDNELLIETVSLLTDLLDVVVQMGIGLAIVIFAQALIVAFLLVRGHRL